MKNDMSINDVALRFICLTAKDFVACYDFVEKNRDLFIRDLERKLYVISPSHTLSNIKYYINENVYFAEFDIDSIKYNFPICTTFRNKPLTPYAMYYEFNTLKVEDLERRVELKLDDLKKQADTIERFITASDIDHLADKLFYCYKSYMLIKNLLENLKKNETAISS